MELLVDSERKEAREALKMQNVGVVFVIRGSVLDLWYRYFCVAMNPSNKTDLFQMLEKELRMQGCQIGFNAV